MNNIYKVIWSKAKNCYVVASEIARAHTKSASGSEKIGGVTRRSLLASLMALSLLCGGLGVASAADGTVSVEESAATTGTAVVYTQEGTESYVEQALTNYDTKDKVTEKIEALRTGDVATNKDNIVTLKTKTDKLSPDGTALTGMTTVNGTTVSGATVEAGALTVKGEISNDAGVTTTLADIKGSMTQTAANKDAIDTLKTKTDGQQGTIDELKQKTAEISHADGGGTKISDVTIKAGNIIGTGNSAITGLTKVETDSIKTDSINGKSLTGTNVATEKNVKDVADAVKAETDARKEADIALEGKITKNSENIATLDKRSVKYDTDVKDTITLDGAGGTTITQLKEANLSDSSTDAVTGKQLYKTNVELAAETKARTDKDTELEKGIAKNSGDITALDDKIKTNADNIQANSNAIAATNKRTAGIDRIDATGETTIEKNVKVDSKGNVTAEGKLKAGSVDAGDGAITTTGAVNAGSLNVTNGATSLKETTVNGKLTAKENATFEKNVTVEKDLTVNGKLNVGEISMKNDTHEPTGKTHDSATSISADGISNRAKVTDEHGNTTESQFTHNEKGTFNYARDEKITGEWKGSTSNVTADGVSNKMTDSDRNTHTYYQTATETREQLVNGDKSKSNFEKKTAEGNTISITEKDAAGNPKSSLTNEQTVDGEKTSVTNKDGSSTINQGADKISNNVKSADGKKSSTEVKADGITNTSDGTIKNDAKDIVNNASGNISNKSQTMDTTVTGKATESYGSLDTTVNGNETHIVKGTKTETVDGQVTENYKAGQATNVTGNQDIHVTGKQTNTVEGGQGNIISGGQTNTITGGQVNNITGDQTTTITGNKKETVEGKVTENFKGGQETNVTGDQTTNVSGTQTTTATDINRNASSSMVDKVDNAYGTNTETKEAGKTTTDVSIKGTGEKGQYIRGANESRDYLIKGTLKNSETKTVEATSTEITDGNGNTSSTIQDKTQISGSVTNGTSSAVSNVKADSIDTAVIEGTNTSLISQKKDSITSAVGNGTTSTVIQQGDKDITIASNGGTVGIVGKDIINNATYEITNTAGTKITDKVGNNTRVIDQTSITDTVGTASRKIEDGKITDTAGDSTVTTENGKGTTFAKTGSTAFSTEAGATKDTNIAGNHITTGRVDANELGVSDKDDQGNTAGLSVKAGEGDKGGIKGSVTDKDGNKTYTKVTATENSFQVQDKNGENTNHQVNTKDKSENTITNGTKANTVTSTADGTTFNNSKANTAFEGGTYTDTTIKGNTITTGKVTMDYADVMKDLGVYGNTTLGEAGKDTTLTVNSKATFNEIATFENGAEVKNGLTVSSGGLKVTGESTFNDKVNMKNGLDVTGGVASDSFTVKGTDIKIDSSGINAGGTVISNVADGSISEGSKDAVNGGQLYQVKNDLEGKVNKVGANAAAMANLHPMEFDPDSKWNIAAAMGNYGSETATAIGAFYRPNEDVMVNFSTAFGTGENMVGGGVSVRLGKGSNKLSREESNALKAQVNDLTARMDALLSVLNPNMSKDFPDVPENHWAYEAVSRLAGNDIVQGYPDGEFHGDRTMTRYEMAEIIYNALSRGAEAEKELVEEFKPELQAMAASEKATAERAEG